MVNNKIKFLPLDKSWYIRLCILSLQDDDYSVIQFLSDKELCDDLRYTVNAIKNFSSKIIDVGESATLLRFLKFYCWKNDIDKKFVVGPMLKKRKICNDKDIVNLPTKKLLELDYGTSQWVSASILMGNNEDINTNNEELKIIDELKESIDPVVMNEQEEWVEFTRISNFIGVEADEVKTVYDKWQFDKVRDSMFEIDRRFKEKNDKKSN